MDENTVRLLLNGYRAYTEKGLVVLPHHTEPTVLPIKDIVNVNVSKDKLDFICEKVILEIWKNGRYRLRRK